MEGLMNQVSKSPDFEIKKLVYEFLYNAYKHQRKWELSLNMHEPFIGLHRQSRRNKKTVIRL